MFKRAFILLFLSVALPICVAQAEKTVDGSPAVDTSKDGSSASQPQAIEPTRESPSEETDSNVPPIIVKPAELEKPAAHRKPAIEVGARFLYTRLLSAKKGSPFDNSFIGSIYKLDAEQRPWMPKPYVQTMLSPHFGFGLCFDYLEAATVDDGGGDGNAQGSALLAYLIIVFSNTTRLAPYAELGAGFYRNTFDPHPDWWQGGRREFILDNSVAPFLAMGGRLALSSAWSLDAYARYVDLDVDGQYVFRGDQRLPEPFTFTLQHVSFGLGLTYRF